MGGVKRTEDGHDEMGAGIWRRLGVSAKSDTGASLSSCVLTDRVDDSVSLTLVLVPARYSSTAFEDTAPTPTMERQNAIIQHYDYACLLS